LVVKIFLAIAPGIFYNDYVLNETLLNKEKIFLAIAPGVFYNVYILKPSTTKHCTTKEN